MAASSSSSALASGALEAAASCCCCCSRRNARPERRAAVWEDMTRGREREKSVFSSVSSQSEGGEAGRGEGRVVARFGYDHGSFGRTRFFSKGTVKRMRASNCKRPVAY